MSKYDVLSAIKELDRSIFTTHELSLCCGGKRSSTVQALRHLEKKGIVLRIARGLWSLQLGSHKLSPYSVIPYLLNQHRAYISFTSALHLYGIIEQIPQVVTLAAGVHTRTVRTKVGTFLIHQIAPSFFKGFDWYQGRGTFLIAEPEKALVDCLYLSARKKKRFTYFPELHFPDTFDFKKVRRWVKEISNPQIASYVEKRLGLIIPQSINILAKSAKVSSNLNII
ncbi:MAG: hypothetical protein HYS08_07930 [Chlamydiae bacterium]|nr:hypothetical protein [Chlamydiota bacterium]MBI3267291.1 hypothetical protein [Chlamydiota bacterium]